MGNEESVNTEQEEMYSNPYIPPLTTVEKNYKRYRMQMKNPEHYEEEKKSSLWHQSHKNIESFVTKWLSQVTLRPIVVTNKIFSMNKSVHESNNKEDTVTEFISKFDNLVIHHSAVQIDLLNASGDIETFVIFPDYSNIIADLCMKGVNVRNKKIYFPIECVVPDSVWKNNKPEMKDVEERKDEEQESKQPPAASSRRKRKKKRKRIWESKEAEQKFMSSLLSENVSVYGKNYGFISRSKGADYADDIMITLTFDGMLDKLLFENEEFMAKCILPKELLAIICNEYIGNTPHHNVYEFRIIEPFVLIKKGDGRKIGYDTVDYEWICHELKDDESGERLTFNTGVNVFGKYFNFETRVDIDRDYLDGDLISYCPKMARGGYHFMRDEIVGKIYCQT